MVVLLPALAVLPVLALEAKWRLFYAAVVFFAVPIALTVRDTRLWLFLAGAASAFNFTKILRETAPGASGESLALSALDVPLAMMLVALFLRATSGGAVRLDRTARGVLGLGLAFVGWLGYCALGARHPDASAAQVLVYCRLLLALALVAACATDAARVRWAQAGLFLGLFAQSALAIAQRVAGSSFGLYEHFEESTAAGVFTRSGGTLNPTVLSEYIGVLAPLVLAAAFTVRRRAAAAALLALFGAAAVASAATLSRAGLVNLGLSTIAVAALALPNAAVPRSRKLFVSWALPLVALVVAAYFAHAVLARVTEVSAEVQGDDGRAAQLEQARDMILANPLTGVGPGNYVAAMGAYGPVLPYPVHNKFLLVTAESGVPGGVLYLALWALTLAAFVRRARRAAGAARMWHGAAAAALGATLLNMNTDVYGAGGAPELALFLVAGLGLGAWAGAGEPARQAVGAWRRPWNRSAPAR
ncbi:O-antigen ligase family protein [Anaeromyxobacter diazotrophicus]|uniref:O-antigen ligase family protein n=1 Tax=Anaeromyxobacter diazotrophicus TaxID=2590199 RepID=UPI001591C5DF|nr:O-antigen ligase family protein [Anaeromyxobacter diazotrophicus]